MKNISKRIDFYRSRHLRIINCIEMAKPIRTTPTLRGEEAKKFLKLMEKRENSPISAIDKKLYASVKKHREYFESFLNKILYFKNMRKTNLVIVLVTLMLSISSCITINQSPTTTPNENNGKSESIIGQCTFQSGIACIDYKINPESAKIVIQNSLGYDIVLSKFTLGKCEANLGQEVLTNGAKTTIIVGTCQKLEKDMKFTSDMSLTYSVTDDSTGIKTSYTNFGNLVAKVE